LDSWRIDASGCYRLDVLLRERDLPLTSEQHEQNLDSLVRSYIGEDRATSLEWNAQNSYAIATPGPVPRQFDRPITFTSAELLGTLAGAKPHDQA
jgi:hypothetical protein